MVTQRPTQTGAWAYWVSAESGLEPGLLATRQRMNLMTSPVTGVPVTLLKEQHIQQLDQE